MKKCFASTKLNDITVEKNRDDIFESIQNNHGSEANKIAVSFMFEVKV